MVELVAGVFAVFWRSHRGSWVRDVLFALPGGDCAVDPVPGPAGGLRDPAAEVRAQHEDNKNKYAWDNVSIEDNKFEFTAVCDGGAVEDRLGYETGHMSGYGL